MVYFRENHFKLSSISNPQTDCINKQKQLDFIVTPEENPIAVDFDTEDYHKIFLANFGYEFPVIVHVQPDHKIYGSSDKQYELKPGHNATFFFIKQTKNWYITM